MSLLSKKKPEYSTVQEKTRVAKGDDKLTVQASHNSPPLTTQTHTPEKSNAVYGKKTKTKAIILH